MILSCLGSNHKEVRKGSAQAVAAIAKLELPKKAWNALIKVLLKALEQQKLEFRLSSLETLSYITEDADPGVLSMEDIDGIFMSVIQIINIDQVKEVQELAISCIHHLIKFSAKNFGIQDETKNILNAIIKCASIENCDIRKKGLMAMTEVLKNFYDVSKPFLADIWTISVNAIMCKDEDIVQ